MPVVTPFDASVTITMLSFSLPSPPTASSPLPVPVICLLMVSFLPGPHPTHVPRRAPRMLLTLIYIQNMVLTLRHCL